MIFVNQNRENDLLMTIYDMGKEHGAKSVDVVFKSRMHEIAYNIGRHDAITKEKIQSKEEIISRINTLNERT